MFDDVHADATPTFVSFSSEVLSHTRLASAAELLIQADAYFAEHSIVRIERVSSVNPLAHRRSRALKDAVAVFGARPTFLMSHCPRENDGVERFKRGLMKEPACRWPFISNRESAVAEGPSRIEHDNADRDRTSPGAARAARMSPR